MRDFTASDRSVRHSCHQLKTERHCLSTKIFLVSNQIGCKAVCIITNCEFL